MTWEYYLLIGNVIKLFKNIVIKHKINKKGLKHVLSFLNDMQSNLLKICRYSLGAKREKLTYIIDLKTLKALIFGHKQHMTLLEHKPEKNATIYLLPFINTYILWNHVVKNRPNWSRKQLCLFPITSDLKMTKICIVVGSKVSTEFS